MTGLFVTWLYSDAPTHFYRSLKQFTVALISYFSLSFHATHLFSPWRHDASSLSGAPVRMWGQLIINNLVSRGIGLLLRSTVIGLGGLVVGIVFLGSFIFLAIWYLLPLVLVSSIVYGVVLIVGGFNG